MGLITSFNHKNGGGTGSLPDVNPNKLLGRYAATAGAAQEIAPNAGLYLDATGNLNMGFQGVGSNLLGGVVYPENSFLRVSAGWTGYLCIDIPFTQPGFIVVIKGYMEEHAADVTSADGNPNNNDFPMRLTDFTLGGRIGHQDILGDGVALHGKWVASSAMLGTQALERSTLAVRFVQESATKWKIYIGEATTSWSNCSAVIHTVLFGADGSDLELASGNWNITTPSALVGTVQKTITNCLPYARV